MAKRAKHKPENCRIEALAATPLPQPPLPKSRADDPLASNLQIILFVYRFLLTLIYFFNLHPPIIQIWPDAPKVVNVDRSWMRFSNLLNLSNWNKVNAKTYLLPLRAPPFRIIFPSYFHVFPGTVPGRHLFIIYVDLMRKQLIWGPLQNPVGTKMASKIDQVAPNMTNNLIPHQDFCRLVKR